MLGKWTDPPYWLNYTFRSYYTRLHFMLEHPVTHHRRLVHFKHHAVLHIDPRGHFTGLRCAAINCLDWLAARLFMRDHPRDELFSRGVDGVLQAPRTRWGRVRKPFINLCEFLANYP